MHSDHLARGTYSKVNSLLSERSSSARGTDCPLPWPGRCRSVFRTDYDLSCPKSIWPCLLALLFVAASVAQAQEGFSYSNNPDDTVTITGYGGPGGGVAIPETLDGYLVTGIAQDAFYWDENVSSVTVPASITNIEAGAFYYCTNLASITVATNNPAYMSLGGVLFSKALSQLVEYPEGNAATDYSIPPTVTSTGANAFALCAYLTNVILPNSLTNVSGAMFADCPRLAGVAIPSAVTSIDGEAFEQCVSLTRVVVPNGVSIVGGLAFSGCTSLTNILLGDSVGSIGNSAFQYCALASVVIPDSVTNIANYAFWYSSNLVSADIGSGVTEMGVQVFSFDPVLSAINVDSNNTAYSSAVGVLFNKNQTTLIQYPLGNPATSYIVPNTVTAILDWAFACATNLTSVVIDEGATYIGNYSFLTCPKLTNVILPDTANIIGYQAFCECSNISSIVIPSGNIGGEVFAGCAGLTNVTLGEGVSSIGEAAFYETSLASLTLPNTLTSIGEYAFSGIGLSNLVLPGGLQSIGEAAFAGCPNLTNVDMAQNVTNLGDGAFANCQNLRTANISDSVAFVGNGAFSGCPLLTSITIPASVGSIGDNAFYGTGLTSVTIPESVTNIGWYAFESCDDLTALYFLGNAPILSSYALTNDVATVYYIAGKQGWSNSFGGLPTVQMPGIGFNALPTNGTAPLTVHFNASGVDTSGLPITAWNWSFGDGATSTGQSTTHTYTNADMFSITLVATNSAGAAVLGFGGQWLISVSPPKPGISQLNVSGTNLAINVTNGVAGATYSLLASTNLTLPLPQWTPITNTVLTASGNFTLQVANAVSDGTPQQFYVLQCHGSYPPPPGYGGSIGPQP
jgi:hypothetical protein